MEILIKKISQFLPLSIQAKIENVNPELLNGSATFFSTKIIGLIFSYVYVWWFSSEYGAYKWGFVAYCITLLNIAGIICLMGYDTILIKYVSEYKSFKSNEKIKDVYLKAFVPVFFVSSIVGGLFFVLAPNITEIIFGKPTQSPWIQVVGIGIPAYAIFQLNNSVLGGAKKMVSYGIYKNIFLFLLALIFGIFTNNYLVPVHLPQFADSGILIFLAYSLVLYLGASLNFLSINKEFQFFKSKSEHSQNFSELFKQSYPLVLATSMSLIVTSADIIMLGIFRPENEVGIYDIAVKLSLVTSIFLIAVNAIVPAKFSEFFAQKDFSNLKLMAHQSSKMIALLSFPILFFLLFFAKPLLSFFGEEFSLGYLALILLTISQFVNSMCGAVGTMLKMTNNQVLFQNIMLSAAALNIVLNYFLIPVYGLEGAAIATLTTCVYWNLISVYFVRKKFGFVMIYIPGLT